MRHRDDIDGLRAVAVVPVVLFHFGIQRVPGGFVGVDVFFVISGFLISRIIFEEVSAGTFSIFEFYNRRVRRIFPALFAVLFVCIATTSVLDLPLGIKSTTNAAVATVLFLSNLYFYSISDYFDAAIQTNPLLHTWSLAVEEQFYLIFPLVALQMRRLPSSYRQLVIPIITVLSLAASVWLVASSPSAAFYQPQSRAWELLLGSLLALYGQHAPTALKAEVLAAAGLAAIIASIFLVQPTTPFPGLGALAPCLGTAAIIYAGIKTNTLTGRFLSVAPLKQIGLASYSIYLWHWPVIVFYILVFGEPSRWGKLFLLAFTLAISALSLRFIERPFRAKPSFFGMSPSMAGGAAVLTAFIVAVIVGSPFVLSKRFPENVSTIEMFVKYDASQAYRRGSCFLTIQDKSFDVFQKEACLKLDNRRPNVLLIGDSHAAHLWPGLHSRYPQINFLQATASGCKPITGAVGAKRCTDLMNFVFTDFLPKNRLDGIILSANWESADVTSAVMTAQSLKQYSLNIFIAGPIVQYEQALPRLLARDAITYDHRHTSEQRREQQMLTDKAMAAAFVGNGTTYISVYKALCERDCIMWSGDGRPLQFDYGHLTAEGSNLLADLIGPTIIDAVLH